jgi:hypothetical protein
MNPWEMVRPRLSATPHCPKFRRVIRPNANGRIRKPPSPNWVIPIIPNFGGWQLERVKNISERSQNRQQHDNSGCSACLGNADFASRYFKR